MKFRYFIISILSFLTTCTIDAQTFFYKRSQIINRGNVKKVNDDAHYITFTQSVCYDSDKNGISINSSNLKFIKKQNDILCYYGNSFWGADCYCYVSISKDRINFKKNNIIYVYEKINPKQNTAKLRKEHAQNNIYIKSPLQNSTESNSSYRKKRKKCPACNGEGKGIDQIIYTPNYTGKSNDIYCNICRRVMSNHTHHQSVCRTCHGKGYIEY